MKDMELTMEQLSKLQNTAPNSGEPDVKTNVGDVFKSKPNGFYLNEFYLFITHFNTIFIHSCQIDFYLLHSLQKRWALNG
jgi:hypothetical protein